MTNHEAFQGLGLEARPIVELARALAAHALVAHDEAERGDADHVLTQATIVTALAYQIVAQLGGDLDAELRRYREEARAMLRLTSEDA